MTHAVYGEAREAVALRPSIYSFSSDSFGRLRVSQPETLLDSKQLYDAQPLLWDDQETSGGGTSSTHSTALAASTMSVSASTAGSRVRQTFGRYNYQPGKSQLLMCTGVLGAGAAGITRRIGLFDGNNGLYFQLEGTTLSVVRRTKVSGAVHEITHEQAEWSLDTMDGTGTSGFTLDTSKAQVFFIDLQWLGVGSVRFGFVIGGVAVYCHQITSANVLSTVYMSTPNLPVRYEISNDGTGGAASLVHICATVISEGGAQGVGIPGAVSTAGAHVDANAADALYALVGIRLKAAYLGARVDISEISVMNEQSQAFEWSLLLNPTVAGTFDYTDITGRSLQRALGATANTVTGGTVLNAGFVAQSGASRAGASQPLTLSRQLGASIAGTLDTIVLCARPLGVNADIQGVISYREW